MRIKIKAELPDGVFPRPVVGNVYEAERKPTPDPCQFDAFHIPQLGVWVFPEECEVVKNDN